MKLGWCICLVSGLNAGILLRCFIGLLQDQWISIASCQLRSPLCIFVVEFSLGSQPTSQLLILTWLSSDVVVAVRFLLAYATWTKAGLARRLHCQKSLLGTLNPLPLGWLALGNFLARVNRESRMSGEEVIAILRGARISGIVRTTEYSMEVGKRSLGHEPVDTYLG